MVHLIRRCQVIESPRIGSSSDWTATPSQRCSAGAAANSPEFYPHASFVLLPEASKCNPHVEIRKEQDQGDEEDDEEIDEENATLVDNERSRSESVPRSSGTATPCSNAESTRIPSMLNLWSSRLRGTEAVQPCTTTNFPEECCCGENEDEWWCWSPRKTFSEGFAPPFHSMQQLDRAPTSSNETPPFPLLFPSGLREAPHTIRSAIDEHAPFRPVSPCTLPSRAPVIVNRSPVMHSSSCVGLMNDQTSFSSSSSSISARPSRGLEPYGRKLRATLQQLRFDVLGSTLGSYVHSMQRWLCEEPFDPADIRAGDKVHIFGSLVGNHSSSRFSSDDGCSAASEEEFQRNLQGDVRSAIGSLVWMSYRRDLHTMLRFESVVEGSAEGCDPVRVTSDSGWGCTIRCTQMMLFNVLLRHFGVDSKERVLSWFLDVDRPAELYPLSLYAFVRCSITKGVDDEQQMMTTTSDDEIEDVPPSFSHQMDGRHDNEAPLSSRSLSLGCYTADAPLSRCATDDHSISMTQQHKRTRKPRRYKQPGDWFGPATAAYTAQRLLMDAKEIRGSLGVYVSSDGLLDISSALAQLPRRQARASSDEECQQQPQQSEGWQLIVSSSRSVSLPKDTRGLLLCFPLKLSSSRFVHSIFHYSLSHYFELKQFAGCVGARAGQRKAFFFFGKTTRKRKSTETPSVRRRKEGGSASRGLRRVGCLYATRGGGRCRQQQQRNGGRSSGLGTAQTNRRRSLASVELLYLDPHFVQECATDVRSAWESFHNPAVYRIQLAHLTPGLMLAFYVTDEAELRELAKQLEQISLFDPDAPLVVREETKCQRIQERQNSDGFVEVDCITKC